MRPLFRAVDIFVFDFHLSVRPLNSPELLQPDFRFLTSSKLYGSRYKAGDVLETNELRVAPLSPRIRARNHFWKHYKRIFPSSVSAYWKLQLPYVCTPRTSTLEFVCDQPNLRISTRAFVFLTALGWSTNLEISIQGELEPPQLREIIASLVDRDHKPFRLDGEARNLAETFKSFAELMKRNVCAQPAELGESLRVPRYLVISPSQYDGPLKFYRTSAWADNPTMTDADRAMMHGILSGRTVSLQELAALENERKFLLTRFGNGANFAITYFRHGTLLFMQEDALAGRHKSLHCLASNVRSFCMIVLMLMELVVGAPIEPELELTPEEKLQQAIFGERAIVFRAPAKRYRQLTALYNAARETLFLLGQRYTNALCRTWFLKHALLRRAAESWQPGSIARRFILQMLEEDPSAAVRRVRQFFPGLPTRAIKQFIKSTKHKK